MEPSLETADEESERAKHNEHNKNLPWRATATVACNAFVFFTLLCNVDNHGGCTRERRLTTSARVFERPPNEKARQHTMKCQKPGTSTCEPSSKRLGVPEATAQDRTLPLVRRLRVQAQQSVSPVWRVWAVQPVQAVQEVRIVKIVRKV